MSDLTQGFVRPQLFKDGEARFNLEMARLQSQLNQLLDRLGGSALLGPASASDQSSKTVDTPQDAILQGEYIATVTDTAGWIVPHSLGRVPEYAIIARGIERVDAIWDGTTPWTDTLISLDASHNNREIVLYVW